MRAGRIFITAVPEPLFTAVDGGMRIQRQVRLRQVDIQNHSIFQFRTIVWSILAATLVTGTLAAIGAAVGAALAVPAAATVGGGTAAACGGGAAVIPLFSLFSTAAAEEVAKAAAVVIVVTSLAVDPSEARAASAPTKVPCSRRARGCVAGCSCWISAFSGIADSR